MKIVGGKLKGRNLEFIKTKEVRPMTEKVRSAIYDILQDWIVGKSMLDLFCGSGSVGIEALSRGAAHIDFVDLGIRSVTRNVVTLGLQEQAQIYRKDVFEAAKIIWKKNKTYDFIFIGAPYPFKKIPKILKDIDDFGILAHNGRLILEHEKGLVFPAEFKTYLLKRTYTYGQTIIQLYESRT